MKVDELYADDVEEALKHLTTAKVRTIRRIEGELGQKVIDGKRVRKLMKIQRTIEACERAVNDVRHER